MKTHFTIPGFVGTVDMRTPVIPNGSFTWGEFLHWEDFDKKDIRVPREKQHSYNILHLATRLQTIRDKLKIPMKITSGYRPDPYNKRAGGEPNSLHKLGMAVDFTVGSGVNHYALAKKIDYEFGWNGGVGGYPTWVHLDIGSNRKWGF